MGEHVQRTHADQHHHVEDVFVLHLHDVHDQYVDDVVDCVLHLMEPLHLCVTKASIELEFTRSDLLATDRIQAIRRFSRFGFTQPTVTTHGIDVPCVVSQMEPRPFVSDVVILLAWILMVLTDPVLRRDVWMTDDFSWVTSSKDDAIEDVGNIVIHVPDRTEVWLVLMDAVEYPLDQIEFTIEDLHVKLDRRRSLIDLSSFLVQLVMEIQLNPTLGHFLP